MYPGSNNSFNNYGYNNYGNGFVAGNSNNGNGYGSASATGNLHPILPGGGNNQSYIVPYNPMFSNNNAMPTYGYTGTSSNVYNPVLPNSNFAYGTGGYIVPLNGNNLNPPGFNPGFNPAMPMQSYAGLGYPGYTPQPMSANFSGGGNLGHSQVGWQNNGNSATNFSQNNPATSSSIPQNMPQNNASSNSRASSNVDPHAGTPGMLNSMQKAFTNMASKVDKLVTMKKSQEETQQGKIVYTGDGKQVPWVIIYDHKQSARNFAKELKVRLEGDQVEGYDKVKTSVYKGKNNQDKYDGCHCVCLTQQQYEVAKSNFAELMPPLPQASQLNSETIQNYQVQYYRYSSLGK